MCIQPRYEVRFFTIFTVISEHLTAVE